MSVQGGESGFLGEFKSEEGKKRKGRKGKKKGETVGCTLLLSYPTSSTFSGVY